MSIKRVLPGYCPDFTTDVKGWTVNHIRRNFWRFWGFYEFDDLLQDGCLHFYRLCNKYPLVRHRPHMVRLYQRTYTSCMHDVATRCSNLRRGISYTVASDDFTSMVAMTAREQGNGLEPLTDAEGGLAQQELALLMQESLGDLELLCRRLGVSRVRIKNTMRRMPEQLRNSLSTTNPNRVYICEKG